MKVYQAVSWLSALIAGLALIAAGAGLLCLPGGSVFSYTTVRGVTVQLYGQGWYRLDTPIAAADFMAAAVVTLAVALPLLVISTLRYRRGSLKGGLLLSGALACFLYNYGSLAFGSTYTNLFLVYSAILSASLFGLILVLMSFDVPALPAHFTARLPHRGISVFLVVSGVILLLVFTVTLGLNLTAAGIAQLLTGVISTGQALGFTVPFVVLTLIAVWLTVLLFRNFTEPATAPVTRA